MKLFLSDQQKYFKQHLKDLKNYAVIKYDKEQLECKVSELIINSTINFSLADPFFDFIFDYRIFPPNILTAYPQWMEENRSIQIGDTIVQQINIPPFNKFSLRVIVGVRIKEFFNFPACKGFSYETLHGHVEKGISTFKIELKDNSLRFTIETYSEPADPWLKLLQSFSSLYQDYCTNKALKNVGQMLRN